MPEVIRIDDLTINGELFIVLTNSEEQFSLWPAARIVPAGWVAVASPRSKAECLKYVDEQWVDMRPKSLRERMTATTVSCID